MSLLNNMLGNAAQGLLGAQTLEDQIQQQIANRYTQGLAQSMMNAQNQTQSAIQGAYAKQAKSSFDPNKVEAYQVPLSQLITLWQAKFNDTWVDMGLEHEAFWRAAYRRLENLDKFERAEGWVRLREDA